MAPAFELGAFELMDASVVELSCDYRKRSMLSEVDGLYQQELVGIDTPTFEAQTTTAWPRPSFCINMVVASTAEFTSHFDLSLFQSCMVAWNMIAAMLGVVTVIEEQVSFEVPKYIAYNSSLTNDKDCL
jgi:hypothetical protein